MIIRVVKERNILSLYVDASEKPVEIDCKPAQIVIKSYTGRTVKHLPKAVSGVPFSKMDVLCAALRRAAERGDKSDLERIEPFLPYFDKLEKPFPHECPKGYIKFVLENDLKFCKGSLSLFKRQSKFTPTVQKLLPELQKKINSIGGLLDCMNTPQQIETIVKYFDKITDGVFYYNFSVLYEDFYFCARRFADCGMMDHFFTVFNKDHRLDVNVKALKEYQSALKDITLIKREDVIRQIIELSNETYTIVVPKNPEDFTNEGNMQNNCVGYNYHNYVRRGEGVIYFIRLTNSPDKSYITCRHDYRSGKTIEHKMKNNTSNKDEAAKELIKRIDEMIREIIKAKQ